MVVGTPLMSGVREMFVERRDVGVTPRFGGLRSLFGTAILAKEEIEVDEEVFAMFAEEEIIVEGVNMVGEVVEEVPEAIVEKVRGVEEEIIGNIEEEIIVKSSPRIEEASIIVAAIPEAEVAAIIEPSPVIEEVIVETEEEIVVPVEAAMIEQFIIPVDVEEEIVAIAPARKPRTAAARKPAAKKIIKPVVVVAGADAEFVEATEEVINDEKKTTRAPTRRVAASRANKIVVEEPIEVVEAIEEVAVVEPVAIVKRRAPAVKKAPVKRVGRSKVVEPVEEAVEAEQASIATVVAEELEEVYEEAVEVEEKPKRGVRKVVAKKVVAEEIIDAPRTFLFLPHYFHASG